MKDKPDFLGHQKFSMDEALEEGLPINNFIVEPISPDDAWIKATTQKIGDWRAYFRSTYIRWALSINGLHVAQDRYDSKKEERTKFKIDSIRNTGLTSIALWDMEKAAKNHGETIPMLAAWGLTDLYSCIEEFVFEIYKIYLNQHPISIIKGDDFRSLRRLKREAVESEEKQKAWEEAWADRLESWQRKRLYDGLSKVFLAYASVSGIKTPSIYTLSTVETWADTIKGIGELRNCFTHGVDIVTPELAEFSKKPHSMSFDFIKGESLKVELRHLQSVECFLDQLLTALNFSLMERSGVNLSKVHK